MLASLSSFRAGHLNCFQFWTAWHNRKRILRITESQWDSNASSKHGHGRFRIYGSYVFLPFLFLRLAILCITFVASLSPLLFVLLLSFLSVSLILSAVFFFFFLALIIFPCFSLSGIFFIRCVRMCKENKTW